MSAPDRVETSGEPEAVAAALARVADGGVVVVAVAPLPETIVLDTYADLHARSLELHGAAR
jgi:threonine dehydrogenase-like Zn-dependent dehydrogenase